MDRHALLDTLTTAALTLAADRLWEEVTLADIAREAGVALAACHDAGVSRLRLSRAMTARMDRAMLGEAEAGDRDQSPRDRLFDVVMARFDAMEETRAAWTSVLMAVRADAGARLDRVSMLAASARWALEGASIPTAGLAGRTRVAGLVGILARAEEAWLEDGPDLSRTMARLDQDLRAGARTLGSLRDWRERVQDFMARRPAPRHEAEVREARDADGAPSQG